MKSLVKGKEIATFKNNARKRKNNLTLAQQTVRQQQCQSIPESQPLTLAK